MGCGIIPLTSGVTTDCNDIPTGGIVSVYATRFEDAQGKLTELSGEVTNSTIAAGKIVNLEFNIKDGYSKFDNDKMVEASGITKAIPSVYLEFPKMTVEKRNALELFTTPNTSYVLFIEDASGVRHAVGMDFGVWGSEANGQSGASRNDKNMFNLKFEGEEISLARTISENAWAQIQASLKP